jgi:hypothetical protein
MSQRVIRRAADQSRAAVGDLLEAAFVAELISPGSRLLVVSPWITDFPILDNRAGRFTHLDTQWGASRIRLSHFRYYFSQIPALFRYRQCESPFSLHNPIQLI